jgi:Na+:H+ antiporter, NhaA family
MSTDLTAQNSSWSCSGTSSARTARPLEMHDALYESRGTLGREDLIHHASGLGLEMKRFTAELDSRAHAPRVQRDVDSGLASGVTGTPGFFVGGRLHGGTFDAASLTTALETAAGP